MNRLVAVILLGLAISSRAQVDHEAYVSATIADATTNMGIDPDAQYNFDSAHSRYLIKAKYTGQHRQLAAPIQNYLAKWVAAFRHPTSYLELFPFEVAIEQDGRSYWMPLQKSLVEAFADEVADGATVKLYVTAIGAWEQEPIFVINAFDAR